jgi:archaemetzincin
MLPRRKPEDAVCLFGVTMADLYPGPRWNFVFGEASLRGGVGIWSFGRFYESFHGGEDTEESRRRALRRACRLVVHEAGHTFSIVHCVKDMCVMNGSNSLSESDSQPLHLCPECLRKLRWNRGFDVLARYDALAAFCERNGLAEEGRWFRKRAARIRTVK